MARSRMGLHTKEEQEYALKLAKGVHQEVMEDGSRGAFLYARGYLLAIWDLAKAEGAVKLMDHVEELLRDLH